MLRIFHGTQYDFIRWWKWAAGITIAFIVIGVGSLLLYTPNFSIEFTGGTLMQLQFSRPADVGELRGYLDAAGIRGAEIQQIGSNRDYTIRASTDGGVTWENRGQLRSSSYLASFAADPANSAILYAGGDSGSMFQSLDGARSWKRIDGDQIHEAPISIDTFEIDRISILSVGIDGTVYAATRNAVFATKIVARRHAVGRR